VCYGAAIHTVWREKVNKVVLRREVSEALLDQQTADDERISTTPQAASNASSPRQRRRKSSATVVDPVVAMTTTSREPRPLTAMQELLLYVHLAV